MVSSPSDIFGLEGQQQTDRLAEWRKISSTCHVPYRKLTTFCWEKSAPTPLAFTASFMISAAIVVSQGRQLRNPQPIGLGKCASGFFEQFSAAAQATGSSG